MSEPQVSVIAVIVSAFHAGNVLNSFNPDDNVNSDIASAVNKICLDFVWLGLACMVASYLEVAAWMMIGAHSLALCRSTDREMRRWLGVWG